LGGIVGITGSPGTGKKSVSPLVARTLGLPCISLNELALSHGLVAGGDEGEVDTIRMRKMVADEIKGPAVLFGHILPYVLGRSKVSRCIVLRCEPSVLKRRLVERGYSLPKLTQNLEAELIGVVSADAYKVFGAVKTFEVATTHSSPSDAAKVVAATVRGDSRPLTRIDWTAGYDSEKLRSLLSGAT